MALPAIDYAAPSSVDEAVDLLARHPGSRPLGGGQRLISDLRRGRAEPGLLVDLGNIAELRGVVGHPDGAVELRAATTLAEVAEHPAAAARPLLSQTIAAVTDPHVRNRATVGGAVRACGRADLAAALLVLDAQVETADGAGVHRGHAGTLPAASDLGGGIITGVRLPPVAPGRRGAYERVADPATLGPVCGVAVALELAADGTVAWARVAVTGALATALRLTTAEAALAGTPVPDDAGYLLGGQRLPFLDTAGASAAYRRHLTGVLLTRALRRAAAA